VHRRTAPPTAPPSAVRHPGKPSPTIPRVLTPRVGNPSKAWSRAATSDANLAFSRLLSGMAVWGGIGAGLDKLFGTWPTLFAIGLIVGVHVAVYLIYTVQKATEEQHRAA
jgi:F0F1-type ATP synthase assembly protein I